LGGRRIVSFGARRGKLRLRERDCSPLPEQALAQVGCLRTSHRGQFRARRGEKAFRFGHPHRRRDRIRDWNLHGNALGCNMLSHHDHRDFTAF
jgi:hypothetical protein